MTADELKQRLDQIDGYSKALVQALRVMDQLRWMLCPLLDNESLKSTLAKMFEKRHGAYAYNHIIPLFAQDLVRDCSRLFLDDHKKACSLVNIHRKVGEKEILDELRNRFRHIPDHFNSGVIHIPGLTAEEEAAYAEKWQRLGWERYEDDFSQSWNSISEFVLSLEKNEISNKVKTFRDKHHAHLEMSPLGDEPAPFNVEALGLNFNELFAFIDEATQHSVNLTRIITGASQNIKSFTEIHQKQGTDMWKVLTAGSSAH